MAAILPIGLWIAFLGPEFVDLGGLRGSPNWVNRDIVQPKVAGRGQDAIADRLSHHRINR
jgi:hypothetical protein